MTSQTGCHRGTGSRSGPVEPGRVVDGTTPRVRSPERTGAGGTAWRALVALFFAGWAVTYANRTILSVAMRLLGQEWSLGPTELGLINSAFFLAYALMQVPSGVLGDVVSRRLMLLSGWFVQTAGTLATALSPGVSFLAGARIATGVGQGTYYSTQYALANAAVPPPQRGRALAVINSGMSAGVVLGWGAGALLVYGRHLPWRSAFLALGVVTGCLGVAMLVLVRERPGSRCQAGASQSLRGEPYRGEPRRAAIACRGVGGRVLALACATSFCSMYGFYMLLTWLPFYLQVARRLGGVEAGLVSTLVPLVSVPASLVLATWCDRCSRGSLRRGRALRTLLPVSALAVLMVGFVPGRIGLYGGILLYGLTGKLVVDPILVAEVAEATPEGVHASAFGIFNLASTVPTFLAPAVTGWLADLTGQFGPAFAVAALLLAVGTVAATSLSRRPAGWEAG